MFQQINIPLKCQLCPTESTLSGSTCVCNEAGKYWSGTQIFNFFKSINVIIFVTICHNEITFIFCLVSV